MALNLSAMNSFAQSHWLRKPGEERWEMLPSKYQKNAKKIVPLLKKLNMLDQVFPSQTAPDYAILLGATTSCMQTRMMYLITQIENHKFTPKKIIILTGDRPLDPQKERKSDLLDPRFICKERKSPSSTLPKTESEAAKFIWNHLPKPHQINSIPVEFVPTSMIKQAGKLVRPTTIDTIETWLYTKPHIGSIVAISNNPYIPFQEETMKPPLIKSGWFKNGGTLEVIGDANDDKTNMAVQLDTIARYMYSLLQTQKAKKEYK